MVQSMRVTPRHEFVLSKWIDRAYFDMSLPIGERQTISPPMLVAYMTEQLEPQPNDRVLEIGTGSGYQAAVLSPLVKEVYSIEIIESLGKRAKQTLTRLKYTNVFVKIGDGYLGWPEKAPFDKIIVTCSPEKVPQPLIDQLKEGGRMIIPVGERYQQVFHLLKKQNGELINEALRPTLFVPMTGKAEESRQVQPDPLHPKLINSGFEEVAGTSGEPTGWYYIRQMKVVTAADAPEGRNYVTFSNSEPGRGCRALQGFPIDGRKVHELELSCMVRGDGHSSRSRARTGTPVCDPIFGREPRHRGTRGHRAMAGNLRVETDDGSRQGAASGARGDRQHRAAGRHRRSIVRRCPDSSGPGEISGMRRVGLYPIY